jgi:uncharacterized membrane protein YczE
MTDPVFLKRLLLLLLGITVMALGVSLTVQAHLGTSPISSVPYVASIKFSSISLGTFTFLWNMLLIFAQFCLLGREFKPYQLMQIPVSVFFGVTVDFTKWLVRGLVCTNYAAEIIMLALGCIVLALGVALTLQSNLVMNSGEALVQAISYKTGKEFGSLKVVFDTTLVILALLLSLLLCHQVNGVREGTIAAALITGFIVRFFGGLLRHPVKRWLAA